MSDIKGGIGDYGKEGQSLREYVAHRKAQYAFRAKIEKQRWEQEVLLPEVEAVKLRLLAGESVDLELPDVDSAPRALTAGE